MTGQRYTSVRLHKVLEELKRSGLYVFTTKDMSRLLDLPRNAASVYVHRMKQDGMIFPLEHGKFSIAMDPFAVSTQVIFPSYISFTTALYLHDRLHQVVDKIYVVTSRRKSRLTIMNTEITFITFSPSRLFGYRKQRKGDSYIAVADLEKAVVDSLYRPRYVPVSQVYEALSQGFDRDLLEDYTVAMRSEAVKRRVGYILELLGKKTTLKPSTKTPYKLNPNIKERGEFNNRWKMYVNEAIR